MPKNIPECLGPDQARKIAEECYGEVLAYCKRHAPSGHEAADLAQETFLRFVRAQGYAKGGWLVSLGMAAFTLWLSSKMRSTMPVAVAPLAITFLGLLGLFSSLTDRIAALTPLAVLDYSFSRMVSYDVGSLVVDLPTIAAILYALALVVLAPMAMRAFRRHQVA